MPSRRDVGEHEDDDVVAVIVLHAAHLTEEFLAALEHFRRVKSRDLTDAEYLSGEVELLEVGADKLGYGFVSDEPENSSFPRVSSETFAMRAMRSASAYHASCRSGI